MPDWAKISPEELLREAGCSRKVIAHCRAVRDCACEYAARCPDADFSLVETGAWLHDIGRSIDHSIRHAQAGADLLRSHNFPEPVVRIVECHLGAGLTAEECKALGLDARDCMPRTIEEKIVTHADNLIAGTTRVTIEESLASASHLSEEIRQRMFRLAEEVESRCRRT
ncbi:MAG: HDIG domain-containing protein [Methanomicrobiales archaeon]|nr:HDIG domain-containing protein [Methanomicrobiales archaeon]